MVASIGLWLASHLVCARVAGDLSDDQSGGATLFVVSLLCTLLFPVIKPVPGLAVPHTRLLG